MRVSKAMAIQGQFRVTELSIVSNFIIVPFPAGLGSVLCPPSNNPYHTSKRGKNGLPHLLFPRELREERNDLG